MTEPDTNRSPKPLSGLTFDVTVEIPKGHKNKYEVDHGTGRIRLDRTLFTSTSYGRLRLHRGHPRSGRRPAGRACAGFGANLPGLPDSVPSHRYVPDARRGRRRRQGALRPASDHRRDHIRDISDVRDDLLLEIEHFFSVYKDLEPGKSVEGSTWTGVDDAEAEVRASFVRAEERHR